jgi:putative peptidoglycan lipid II flippase
MALLFPAVILSALNELLSGVYYSHNRFLTPSFNKILNPAITVVYVLAFGSVMSTSSLVLAMLSAFFIQAVILVAGFLRHKDFDYSLSLEFNHPEVVNIFKLMAPLIAAMAVTKTAPIIDRFFLSRLGEGSISHVGYAYRFTMRLLETTSTGLILVLFPVLSAHAASLDYAKMRHYLMRGIKMLIFLTMPFVAIFAVHGKPAIRFLFERGRFTAYDTDATFRAFAVYLLSVPMVVAVSVLSRGLYAIQKNRLIAGSSVLVMLFYVAVCSALIGFAGCLAVPLANLASFCASAAIFGLFARRFLGMTDFRAHAVETLKNILAAALAALALSPAMGFAKENLVSYTAACLLGGVVYVALSRYAFRLEASETVLCHMESYVKTFFKRISQKRCYGK